VPFGCQLAIDNFGLEASAFSYLRSLPVAYIKVHRSFISGVDANPDNQFYVKSLLQLAQSKEIPLVAEGVETAEELESLKALGVEYVQGFYLGRPEPVQ
jgi:EAL domain-containing protein (putative c-di-GMP-specific phosphodiesterase class I)